jgi:glycosyltransferase involved in cell wall biosynthesis
MKIALLTYALDRNPTGIGQYTQRLLKAFSQIGLDLIVFRAGGGVQGEKVVPLHFSMLPALITIGQIEIGWASKKHQLELVHDPTGTVPLAFCRSKKISTICDVFPLSIPGYSTLLDTLIYKYWLPRIVPRLDRIITISQNSKNDICEYLKMPEEKVEVIHLAADQGFRTLTEEEVNPVLSQHRLCSPYILFVGSLEPRKNLIRLLEAYADLRKITTKWGLVIVGVRNNWKSTPVASKVEELDLQDSVTFTGYLPDEDLPAIYNGADVFCFPSLYEGFGLPVLEAMACGTPVITSNISSLPEVAGDAALLVDPYSVKEIASAMQNLLEDEDLAQSVRDKGLKRAAQFTWERTARETLAVYRNVLGTK